MQAGDGAREARGTRVPDNVQSYRGMPIHFTKKASLHQITTGTLQQKRKTQRSSHLRI